MMHLKLKRVTRGDTIVEVLICIAVVSFVLGSSYASARNSQIAGIRARERDEATKLLEQQAEFLRAASAITSATTTPFNALGSFCLTSTATVDTTIPCLLGSENRYEVAISRSATDVFNILIKWDRAGGGAQEELSSYYRVHRGTP